MDNEENETPVYINSLAVFVSHCRKAALCYLKGGFVFLWKTDHFYEIRCLYDKDFDGESIYTATAYNKKHHGIPAGVKPMDIAHFVAQLSSTARENFVRSYKDEKMMFDKHRQISEQSLRKLLTEFGYDKDHQL